MFLQTSENHQEGPGRVNLAIVLHFGCPQVSHTSILFQGLFVMKVHKADTEDDCFLVFIHYFDNKVAARQNVYVSLIWSSCLDSFKASKFS